MKRKIVLIFAVISTIIVSCSKENSNDLPIDNKPLINSLDFENPYDIVGQYHNIMLDLIIDNYSKKGIGFDSLEFFNSITETLNSKSRDVLQGLGCSFSYLLPQEDITQYYINLIANNNINTELSDYQLNIKQRVFELVSDENVLNPDEFIIQLQPIVEEIEKSNLKDYQKAQTFIFVSVAKYSYQYWFDELSKGEFSKWNLNSSKQKPTGSYQKAMVAVVNSDCDGGAYGAVSGFGWGAIGGSTIPGAGTITGAVAGAVIGGCTGAVGSSAWTGAKKLISGLFGK